MVWKIFENLSVQKILNIEKIISNLISNAYWHKIKMYNFDPYNILLVISTNIAELLMTASVLQGHIIIIITIKSYRLVEVSCYIC